MLNGGREVSATRTIFEKRLRILCSLVLMPLAMAVCIGCANTGSTSVYLIGDEAPAPSGYSAAVLAKRIVPLRTDGA